MQYRKARPFRILLALPPMLGACIPYTVATTARPAPVGEQQRSMVMYTVPNGLESKSDSGANLGASLPGSDVETRWGLDERSDVGIRIPSMSGIVMSATRSHVSYTRAAGAILLATTSAMSNTGTSLPAPVTPSVIIVMQNGHATAIWSAPVASSSSLRSTFTRLPTFSSIHMRPPPAPQHNPLLFVRGGSTSSTTGSALRSVLRGAS